MPWNYHRVLTMRDNPLGAPRSGSTPHSRISTCRRATGCTGSGLSERAIALAYGLNASFGARRATTSLRCCCCFAARSRRRSARVAPKDSVGLHGARRRAADPGGMAGALRGGVELGRRRGSRTSASARPRGRALRRRRARQRAPRRRGGAARRAARDRDRPGAAAGAGRGRVARLPSQPSRRSTSRPRRKFWEHDGFAPSLFTDSRRGHDRAGAQPRRSERGHEPRSLDHGRRGRGPRPAAARSRGPRGDRGDRSGSGPPPRGAARAPRLAFVGRRSVRRRAHGRISAPAMSRVTRRSSAPRTAGCTSAASISPSRAAAWKARWNRASARAGEIAAAT